MKLTHHVPDVALTNNMTGRLSPEYEAEVAAATARHERDYRKAQHALDLAVRKLDRAEAAVRSARGTRERRREEHEQRIAWEIVELRRLDLLRLAELMQTSPQSAQHRGTGSFRPVPHTHQGRN
jgi:hypothetical protein